MLKKQNMLIILPNLSPLKFCVNKHILFELHNSYVIIFSYVLFNPLWAAKEFKKIYKPPWITYGNFSPALAWI